MKQRTKILGILLIPLLIMLLLASFNKKGLAQTPTETPNSVETAIPTETIIPTQTVIPTETATPTEIPWTDPRDPNAWKSWDVLPTVYPPMKDLYKKGLLEGNNGYAFSKFGDCQSVIEYFLAGFDAEWGTQKMGAFSYLKETINWYQGSFQRASIAVEGGLNVAGVQNQFPWQGKPAECLWEENRAQCELRVYNPSIALISYEELWDGDTGRYELHLENLVKTVLAENVVPVLATTGTNEHANLIIAKIAVKYNLPVWNFWAAIQGIPSNGISEDGFHLTIGEFYNFEDDNNLLKGWPRRNLTALMSLEELRRQLNSQ